MTTLGPLLPPDDHFARYCKNSWRNRDPDTRQIMGVSPAAFVPKVKDNVLEDISGNHVEFFELPTLSQNVTLLEQHLRTILKLNKNGVFAVGQVREICSVYNSAGNPLQARSDPTPADQSHAVLLGLLLKDEVAQEKVAQKMVVFEMTTF